MPDDFDLVILGGGPGGYAAALYGAAAGMNIAMVEEQRVGGTCLHRGCIPAKELLQTAEVLRTVRAAAEFGVETSRHRRSARDVADPQAGRRRPAHVRASKSLLKGRKVTVVPGPGRSAPDARTIERLRRHSSPRSQRHRSRRVRHRGALPVDGLAFDGITVLSSDHVLERRPGARARVAVIGGGAIGCEFASFLVDVGAEVTMLEVLPQILTGVDQQVAQTVAARVHQARDEGRRPACRCSASTGLRSRFEGKNGEEQLAVDKVVVSVGRRPRQRTIGLDAAGIKVDERGFVVVDGNMRTNVDGVYAVGDVVATPQLAHVAFSEAIVAIKTMLGEDPLPIDYDKVPWGIYCHPEVGVLRSHRGAGEGAGLRRRDVGAPLGRHRARADHR